MRVCAEPSPDALTAITTSGSGKLGVKDKIDVAAAFSRAESAASIGLRTQSIQLMRDVLYRICEDYQSGALTPAGLETLQRRYQSSMVAILAIEQLTGVVRAPAVVLGGNGSTGSSDKVAALADKAAAAHVAADHAKASADTAATDKGSADKALQAFLGDGGETDPAKMPADRKTKYDALKKTADDASSAVTAANSSLAQANRDAQTYDQAMSAIGAADTAASSTGTVASTAVGPASADNQTSRAVVDAVKGIVDDTLQLGFLREVCATLFVAQIEGRSGVGGKDEGLGKNCDAYAGGTAKLAGLRASAYEMLLLDLRSRLTAGKAMNDSDRAVLLAVSGGDTGSSNDNGSMLALVPSKKNSGKKTATAGADRQLTELLKRIKEGKFDEGSGVAAILAIPKPVS